jgi:Xaa-Pro aminopeptidase
MTEKIEKLIAAEKIASELFDLVVQRNLITPGKSEKQLNEEIFALAKEAFGIEKYWHKRIVRSGPNTLQPYNENPPDLIIQPDDILFFDFGPIIEEWEADFGRTYVIGNSAGKIKLKNDIEQAWFEAKDWFKKQTSVTGARGFRYAVELAKQYGWAFGGEIAGHLIGQFPHERLEPGNYNLYIHPENHNDLYLPDATGQKREWILEIHFIDAEKQIGGFLVQLRG